MSSTSIVNSKVANVFSDFIGEMLKIYNNVENVDIKEINTKTQFVIDERTAEAMNHVRYVTYNNKFKLALCVFEGMLWVDVCMLTQHLTSCIDPETGKIKHAIDLKLVYNRGDKRPDIYDTPIWLQIHGLYKPVRGMFVPIDQLMYYCSPYISNLTKFMLKEFELGDGKGYMYFNAMKSGKKYCGVKVGRTINIKRRTETHKSDVKRKKEQIHFQISIPVSQQYRAERTWKNYIEKPELIWKDCPQKLELFNKITKENEWFELSKNEDESTAQLNLLIECWENYIKSKELSEIKLGESHLRTLSQKEALELEASESSEQSEESQNEEPKTSSNESSEESQNEDVESNQ